MKIHDLNGTHIGQDLTVTSPTMEYRGTLASVLHEGDIISEHTMCGVSNYSVGRRHSKLRFSNGDTFNFDDDTLDSKTITGGVDQSLEVVVLDEAKAGEE